MFILRAQNDEWTENLFFEKNSTILRYKPGYIEK